MPAFKRNNAEDPYLVKLKEDYNITELVSNFNTQLDSVLYVMHWVHELWKHSSVNPPQKNNPATILRKVKSGMRFSCLEYSSVLAGYLNSLGFVSRVVDLYPVDVETKTNDPVHVVVEVFMSQYNKWVCVDSQWDMMPMNYDTPLNAVELQSALWQSSPGLKLAGKSEVSLNEYTSYIAEYLHDFLTWVDIRHAGSNFSDKSYNKIILVSTRSDKPR